MRAFALTVLLLPLSVSACTGSSAQTASVEPAPEAPAVRQVDVSTLKADLDSGRVPLLLDVRSPSEFAAGHVPGARNIPVDQLGARVAELDAADQEVYVICQSGRRSVVASATLAAKGLRPVNVEGGTGAWVDAGYAVEQ